MTRYEFLMQQKELASEMASVVKNGDTKLFLEKAVIGFEKKIAKLTVEQANALIEA